MAIDLDRNSTVPIYQQIGDELFNRIEKGVYKANEKLPAIRKLAEQTAVNNVTIINAYRYLESKKVVYSRLGSGFYVSEVLQNDSGEIPILSDYNKFNQIDNYKKDVINFANTVASQELFPVEKFKAIFSEVLERDGGEAFTYQDSQGYEPLRESLCDYFEEYGIKTSADKLLIVSGAQQGLDIVSKVMISAGDTIFVEKPTYNGALGSFLSRTAQIVEIPIDVDGINIAQLEGYLRSYSPKFIYLMTHYQTPTCISYSTNKKRQILELANKYNVYIIEEDNQIEFNYSGEKTTPLKALDYKNKVVYIKSFSKILMPGLRVGCMVLPKKILQNVLNAKYTSDVATSGFIQRALDLFLRKQEFNSYIKNTTPIFQERYTIMKNSIDKYLSNKVKYVEPNGGLNFWLEIKNKSINIEQLCNELAGRGVIVIPGSMYSLQSENIPYIRLSFSNVDKTKIEKGIFEIGKLLNAKTF